MQELSTIGLMPEDWGGDVPMVKVDKLQTMRQHLSGYISIHPFLFDWTDQCS